MKGQKGQKQNLEIDVIFNREPEQLWKNKSEIYGGSSTNYTGQLKFMKTLERERQNRTELQKLIKDVIML